MNILAFSFFPAFTPVSNGGESRLYNIYKELSKYYKVTLLTSTHFGVEEEKIFHGANFIERRIPRDSEFNRQWQELTPYSSGGDLSAPCLALSAQQFSYLHKAYLEEYKHADMIFHDSPFLIDFDLFLGLDNKSRVYNSYNCESELYKTLHPDSKSKFIIDVVESCEKKMLKFADVVLYCSESDLELLKILEPNTHYQAIYTPNGLTPLYFSKQNINISTNENFSAVFMGSSHLPNQIAAEFIAYILAPLLPDVIFHFIGNCVLKKKIGKNIIHHGVVSEQEKYKILKKMDLALNPIKTGSGSNLKILDYFSVGLPVISTSFGCRGLDIKDSEHVFIESLDNFAVAIKKIISNPSVLLKIGNNAKNFATQKYSWFNIVKNIQENLNKIILSKVKKPQYVLVLNDYNSFINVGGGCVRTQGLYNSVVDSYSSVVFICFCVSGEISVSSPKENIVVLEIPKTVEHKQAVEYFNSNFHVSSDDIVAGIYCIENDILRKVYEILRENARHIIIEHPYMVNIPLLYGDRFIYSSQNDETQLKTQSLQYHPKRDILIQNVTRMEMDAVELSAATFVVSQEDGYSIAKNKTSSGPILVIENGANGSVEVNERALKICQSKIIRNSVVFVGSAHLPNVESANFIIDKLAPKLPDIQFNIVGSVCDSLTIKNKNVILWGVVDEDLKSAILANSYMAINPMFSGSGSNVKLSDYLAHGLYTLSTPFGVRGYSSEINNHVFVANTKDFLIELKRLVTDSQLNTPEKKQERINIFNTYLSFARIGAKFVNFLSELETVKKKILVVTYRYTYPLLGGAESYLHEIIKSLGNTGLYSIDIVCPDVGYMESSHRFMENYYIAHGEFSTPINIPNIRWARFNIDLTPDDAYKDLEKAWANQPLFEYNLYQSLFNKLIRTSLLWGWVPPHGEARSPARWAYTFCGLYIDQDATILIKGWSSSKISLSCYNLEDELIGSMVADGFFSWTFFALKGVIKIITSANYIPEIDYRPLAFVLNKCKINEQELDISNNDIQTIVAEKIRSEDYFEFLSEASMKTRTKENINLTDIRGPWSTKLDEFLIQNIKDYDLVITHNPIFKPCVNALKIAAKNKIPSILIPHAHMDDDYYHFPDFQEACKNASLVLSSPKITTEFLKRYNPNTEYLPAGINIKEKFTNEDVLSFKDIYTSNIPFVLVLGRKAGAKGYHETIKAVKNINKKTVRLNVVMIGPDDDQEIIDDNFVHYLGRQPRCVVRGALQSCLSLVNMSTSESFGIVILEAWMARKPVILNKGCPAFHDFAIHETNSLLVMSNELEFSIVSLLESPKMCEYLGENGYSVVKNYSWDNICKQFLECTTRMIL